MFNAYPYTDFHEMNLDWVIRKIKEFDAKLNTDIKEYIREELNNLFIDSVYDPATETLILILSMEDDNG